MAALKLRIQQNRLALQMIEGQSHRRERRSADRDAMSYPVGVVHRPLQRLHAANGCANRGAQVRYSEFVEDMRLGPDNIANADEREVRSIWLAGSGIDRGGAGRTVARPQQVGTDDAVAREIKNGSTGLHFGLRRCRRREHLRPPVGHTCRARQRVTHQHGIVTLSVQFAINAVANGDRLQRAAGLQLKGFLTGERDVAFSRWLQNCTHS